MLLESEIECSHMRNDRLRVKAVMKAIDDKESWKGLLDRRKSAFSYFPILCIW